MINETVDKDAIKNALLEKLCQVTFTKKDGSNRVMNCTLNSSMIPTTETDEGSKRTKAENPDVQPVYDVEAQAWRSFRWDSIKIFRADLNL